MTRNRNDPPFSPQLRIGSGEPLVLLHPFATNWRVWHLVAKRLSDTHEILAPTMAGHWGGPKLPGLPSVGKIADGVERILDEAGWKTAHFAGNSLGGLISLELARRGRARSVTAIAAAGGWYRYSLAELRVGLWFLARYPLVLLARPLTAVLARWAFARNLMLRWVCHHADRVATEDATELLRAVAGCSVYPSILLAFLSEREPLPSSRDVSCPVRFVSAERDVILPGAAYRVRFETELPHASFETLPDVGHIPMLEAPDAVSDVIRRHVSAHA